MTEWVITCNTNAYNVVGAFDKLDTVDWKQSTNVNVGDIIYIYVGAPVRAISYKCEAIQVELSEDLIDDSEFVLDDSNYGNYGRYMRLHLLEKYEEQKLGYNFLKANGLKTVQVLALRKLRTLLMALLRLLRLELQRKRLMISRLSLRLKALRLPLSNQVLAY